MCIRDRPNTSIAKALESNAKHAAANTKKISGEKLVEGKDLVVQFGSNPVSYTHLGLL